MDRSSLLAKAARHQSANRINTFKASGIDLIIGEREGFKVYDIDGTPYWDCHLNGGTYSFGHRHPVLVETLIRALATLDIGNHHFVSPHRVALAEALSAATPGNLVATVYASGGGEAVDVAIRSARYATGRRKILAFDRAYHGRTGLSGAAGDDTAAAYFLSDMPEDFIKLPFNDIPALERAFTEHEFAGALVEIIPATYGFPTPAPGYLPRLKALCVQHDIPFISDEVQTGLGRTGHLWGCQAFGVVPDMLVTGKSLSGGLYPVAACVLGERYASWLNDNGWGHVSTFGGAEPGCVVGLEVLRLAQSSEVIERTAALTRVFAEGFAALGSRYPYLKGIRQTGLVMGLEFDAPDGGVRMMKALYDAGIWAIVANYDSAVLQFKPGLLLSDADAAEILERFETALKQQLQHSQTVSV
jgi:putrescine aminotransferase